MTEVERLLYKELYRRSFYDFVKDFWNTADPSKFVDGKVVKIYCEIFQFYCKQWTGYNAPEIDTSAIPKNAKVIDVRNGKHNLCINVPPRHTKSMIFNVFGPVWLWLSYPIKAVSISHTGGLAGEMNSKRYAIINSEKFQFFFSDIYLITNTAGMLKDSRGGELRSLNRNAFTGYGGDVIINDDLTNAETARKDMAEMANAWSYYQNTMPSRINDIDKCIIMNIQQRLAPNDITGHILNDEKLASKYEFVVLPAIFDEDTYVVCPISGDIIHFKKGDGLWPERFGDYSELRYQVGETIFETQYLQHPIATDKTVIKPSMIIEKQLTEVLDINNADMIYASHDFPVKDKDTSDFLGSILAYRIGSNIYIKDCLEKKMAFIASVNYVRSLDTLFPGIIQIIEDKANGSPIIQQLQDEVAGIHAFNPGTASKMQRLESSSLYINNIIFVKTKWNELSQTYELSDNLKNLVNRLLNFPFVEHDDIIDAFSMLILFVFMDKRYMVYGRSFDDSNVIDSNVMNDLSYSTVFFNKEGDTWKAVDIAVEYDVNTKLVAKREIKFKASVEDGLNVLKKFAPDKSVFIDCSANAGLNGIINKSGYVERYDIDDFDKSVAQLNLAFAKKLVLIDESCKLTKVDIESFKFSKSKDDNMKYATKKDGFVACLRMALHYYGGVI